MTDGKLEKTEVLAGGDSRFQPRLGRYVLERRLGGGGMAEIFLARIDQPAGAHKFEKQVVIKRILPQLVANPKFVEMFLREARLLAGLDHPNIVRIIELDVANNEYFLALEYLEGLSLREVAERHWAVARPLPIEAIVKIVADAALGLEHAHACKDPEGRPANLVHRDVSPDNLFVTTVGVTKVIDWGIAKREGMDTLTQTGELKGKIPFMSPEHLKGEVLDARSDLFSVGIVLYWLLSGRRPFDGVSEVHTMKAILEDTPRPLRQLNPRVPLSLEDVVMSLLEKNRDRRMKSASTLHDALLTLLVGLPRGAPQPAELVQQAMKLPALTHEVIPPGLAAVPALTWPETAPPTSVISMEESTSAARKKKKTDDEIRLANAERLAKWTPESDADLPKTETQLTIDLSTDEHKRTSEAPFNPASDPLIDVERVAIDTAPRRAAGARPDAPTLERAPILSDAPTVQRMPLDETPRDPRAPAFGLAPVAQAFFSIAAPDETQADTNQTIELNTKDLGAPPIPYDEPPSRALPVMAGVITALLAVGGLVWFSGILDRKPLVDDGSGIVDAGAAPVVAASFDAGGAADAGVVVVVIGGGGGTDAGAEEPEPPEEDAGPGHPPQPPRARLVLTLLAPHHVQWLGPTGEVLGVGRVVARVSPSTRAITAVDLQRGGKTRVAVDAKAKVVDYSKLPRQALQIRVRPFAEVFLGKERLGITPLPPVPVVAGVYEVRLVYQESPKAKKIEKKVTIDVKPGKQPATLNVLMK